MVSSQFAPSQQNKEITAIPIIGSKTDLERVKQPKILTAFDESRCELGAFRSCRQQYYRIGEATAS